MGAEELYQIGKLFAALAFTLALMGGLSMLLKKLGFAQGVPTKNGERRLQVIESIAVDARRRLVIVQCDDKQHLILLGQNSETVIDQDVHIPEDVRPKISVVDAS